MRRLLALWLTFFLVVGTAGMGWAAPGTAWASAGTGSTAPAPKSHESQTIESRFVPLILIHGLGGDGNALKGPLESGLEQRFAKAGYQPGKTLFILDYGEHSNGDYVHVAESHLRPLVERVRELTGQSQVDLLGYSMGGLVARYYLSLPEAASQVRTLVLLASPAHGSFAAEIVKDAAVTNAYLQKRGETAGTGATPDFPPAIEPPPPRSLPDFKGAWDQGRYLFDRANRVFEPLLTLYLIRGRLGRDTPALTDFLTWWEKARPGERAILFDLAEAPPTASGPGGEQLTAAYLHALALHAARAWIQSVGRDGGTEGAHLTELAEKVTQWLHIDPRGVAIDRLVGERFTLLQGREYLANHFLHSWNQAEANRRRAPGDQGASSGTRFVVVAGTIPNIYKPWWPAVGANDGAVEAASAWLPLGLADAFYLFEGSPLTASHVSLKLNGQVFSTILSELAPGRPPDRRLSPLIRRWWWRDLEWEESVTIQARRWAPAYLEVDSSRLKGRTGRLTIEVQAGPSLLERIGSLVRNKRAATREPPLVWVEGRQIPIQLQKQRGVWRGTVVLDHFGGEAAGEGVEKAGGEPATLRLGVRLDGARAALPANDHLPVRLRVTLQPDVAPDPAQAATRKAGPEGTPTDPSPAADPNAGEALSLETAPSPASSDRRADDGEPETIWVRNGRRETSHLDPAEESHARWEWDFGDGTSAIDDDPANRSGELEHQFSRPGDYHVTATSISNLGRVLRRQVWDVTVPPAEPLPLAQRFLFDTIRPPWLLLRIDGPPKWITRRPATYRVVVETIPVPWVERQQVRVDPAREFEVAWERPGTFVVRASVTVTTTYRLPEGGRVTVQNTYRVSKQVKVYTPALAGG